MSTHDKRYRSEEISPDVGGLGQLLYHADQQGGQGQHHAQVHRDRRVEEVGESEVGGGAADGDQQD